MAFEALLTGLIGLLNALQINDITSQDQKNQALSALIAATNETRIYIKQYQNTGNRKQNEEDKLCRLWAAAAIPLRKIDKDLSERCLMKSDYWLNPENYSAKDITKFRIGIEQVYKEAKDML